MNIFPVNFILIEPFIFQERKKYKIDSVHKCKVKQIHLFPTFMELEHGLAPSTLEMSVFEECGVPIYFVYPQYFDFDNTAEKLRVEQTEHFYRHNVIHKRDVNVRYKYDISKLRPKPIDLKYFKSLESELIEFMNDANLDKSSLMESCDQTNHQSDDTDNTNIGQLTTQMQMMEVADKIKKDCLLAQDIMNDIEKLCNTNDVDKLKKEIGIDPSEGFWSLNDGSECKPSEIKNFDMTFHQPEEYFSTSISDEKFDVEEVLTLEQCSNSSIVDDLIDFDYEEEYLNFPSASIYNDEDYELVGDNHVADLSDSIININSNKCTNPFLEDISSSSTEDKSSCKGLILNPNNPFLTYRPDKEFDESSNSTEYGSVVQDVKTQTWSIEDSRMVNASNYETASMDLGSSGSSHIATQTVVEDIIQNDSESLEMGESCSNSGQQTNPSNYQQKWMAGNFYEYSAGYPLQPHIYNHYNNFGYPMYPGQMPGYVPQYSSVSNYPTGPYMPGYPPQTFPSQCLPSSTVRPPPGFAPNSNVYQVSRVMQTTVRSNIVANGSGGSDFYDMYNARLRLALESASNEIS